MRNIMIATASAFAIGYGAPALAQGYTPNVDLQKQISEKCAGRTKDLLDLCKQRILNSQKDYLDKNGRADADRARRQSGQANQRVDAQAGRIIDAQRNAQPRK